MNQKIFKAYDIRGRYPGEINEKVVTEIAKKLPKLLGSASTRLSIKKIVVAHDVRLSSPALYGAVIRGLKITSHKLAVISIGIVTTPMFYFLVNELKASGGIMVTASHNPKNYNGLKVVGPNAKPISGREILLLLKK